MDYEYQYQAEYSGMPIDEGAALAFVAGFFGVILLMVLAMHVYLAVCLMKIAQKTNTPNAWFAWIPILNIILLLQIARKPMWWLLLFLIPGINIIFTILVWMEAAKAVGKPEWWGILMIVPFVNLVVPGYLAFSGSGFVQGQQPRQEVAQDDPVQNSQPIASAEAMKEDESAFADEKADDRQE